MIIERRQHNWAGLFQCMASPCEVLIDSDDESLARTLIEQARQEALRIERKFSRYRDDNIVHRIHTSNGAPVAIDAETYRLLEFARQCHEISDGLFDITSGVLRELWPFKNQHTIPSQQQIDAILPRIGWTKLHYDERTLTLPSDMQIDFGGIGKEYAVDRVLQMLSTQTDSAIMVNFGGDCHASGPQRQDRAWMTGIENPHQLGKASGIIELKRGALATSGDAYRVIEIDGVRYSHIINPQTGWPARNAPRSVTVAAPSCTEAGILSTLAILHETDAEAFLDAQEVHYWCYR